ncbi:MAG: hypothetical protein HYY17_09355 [Planctomycetes bacterium]|nr:hypothetical protein [Planctomycetota bacterium]
MKETPARKKRPYRAPTVATEKVYERFSLACGKSNSMVPNCQMNLMS